MNFQRSGKKSRNFLNRLLAGALSIAVFGASFCMPGNMTTVYANEVNEEESNDNDTAGPKVRSVNLNIDGKIAGIYNPTAPESLDSEWSNGTGCYIYFGKMARHRVLDSDTTDFSKDGEHTMLLLCEGCVECGWYNTKNKTNYSQVKANEWKYSEPYLFLDGKYEASNSSYQGNAIEKLFNTVQQNAIIENYNRSHGDWEEVSGKLEYSELDGEKMFLLDAREIEHEEYGFSHTDDISKSRAFDNGAGWLRSPCKNDDFKTGVTCYVDENYDVFYGAVTTGDIYDAHANYPAFNIRLSSIFFTSYREEDRMTLEEMHQACQAIPDLSYKPTVEKGKCNAWTVSIFDGNNDFTAERQDFGQVKPGDNVSINIKSLGTAVEDVEYDQVSAMLVDESGTVLSYGMIKDISNGKNATGSASVKIPDGAESGKYTLKIFAEDMLCEEVSRGQYSFPTGSMASNAVDIEIVVDSRDKTQIEVCNYDPSATYSGKAIVNPTQEQLSIEGAGYEDVVFEWFKDTVSDKTKIDAAPCDAGTYFLMATIPETETRRKSAFISSPIIISPQTITPYITGSISKVYDGSGSIDGTDNTLSVELEGAIEGDDISASVGSLCYADSEIGTNKTIVADGIEITGADKDNYILSTDKATADIGVIGKKAYPFNIPQSRIEAANTVKTVAEAINLPEGWEWEENAGDTAISSGSSVTATAVYTTDDSGYYEITSVEITIIRAACEESEIIVDSEPDCTNKGYGHTVCSLCGDSIRNNIEIDALGHSWDSDFTIDVEADCTKEGSRSIHCKSCNAIKDSEIISAKGHSWNDGNIKKAASCNQEGEKEYTCSQCGETRTEPIGFSEHTPGIPVVENKTATTCTENGTYELVIYCTECNAELSRESKTEEYPGHDWEDMVTVDKEPSCTEEGSQSIHCKNCGSKQNVTVIEPIGHSWNDGTVTTEATCKTEGEKSFVCIACGETKKEIISKLSHTAADPVHENEVNVTCSDPGLYDEVVYCKSCNQEISREKIDTVALGHSLTKIDGKAPTATEEGYKEHWKCDRCGKLFSDENADTEISIEDISIPKNNALTNPEPTSGGGNSDNPGGNQNPSSGGSTKIPTQPSDNPDTPPSSQPGGSQPGSTNPPSGGGTTQTPNPSAGDDSTPQPPQGTEKPDEDKQEENGTDTGKETDDTEQGQDGTGNEKKPDNGSQPKNGQQITDNSGNAVYKVLDVSGRTVEYKKPLNDKQKTVIIPSSIIINGKKYKVTSVADGAFKRNKTITKVEIGSNIKTIGKTAFYGCKALKTIKIGKNVTDIGERAFYKCASLTKLTIPAKISRIDKAAFYGCSKLKLINIKTKKLTAKNTGAKAFAKIHKKAVIEVPASKVAAYKKLFKKKGLIGKKQTVR